MGWFEQLVNSATDLVGVRLFPGGTLSDQGARKARDAAENAAQTAQAQYQGLGALGDMLLGGDSPWAAVLNKRMAQAGDLAAGGTASYGLTPVQQKLLNQQQSIVARTKERALQNAQLQLAKRGITSGPIYDASLARIQQAYDTQLQELNAQYYEQARNQQIAENYAFIQQLLNQIGQGAGLKQSVASGMLGVGNVQQALAADAQARAQLGQERFMNAMSGGLFGKQLRDLAAKIAKSKQGTKTAGSGTTSPNTGGIAGPIGGTYVDPMIQWMYVPEYQMSLQGGGLLRQPSYGQNTLKLFGR